MPYVFMILLIVLSLQAGSFLFPTNTAKANPQDPLQVAKMLQETYNRSIGLMADFRQETTLAMNRRKRSGAGTVIFVKPAHMRWDYMSPDRQVIISNGKTISIYLENEHQMIITSAEDYLQSDVTHSFFSGTGDILRDFEVLAPDNHELETEGAYLIKLIPKKLHPHVATLHIWTTQDTFLIKRLQITDHFDTITDIFFENVLMFKNNEDMNSRQINQDLFNFTPPPGTEILKQ